MLCLTIFAYGLAWRLLDEHCAEVGSFPSRARALAAAWAHVRRLGEPRHALVRGASGWREILVTPSGLRPDPPHATDLAWKIRRPRPSNCRG